MSNRRARTSSAADERERILRLQALDPAVTREHAARLLKLTRRHDVRWQVWPERRVFTGEMKQIGFEIDLNGDHDEPRHRPTPGCDECEHVYRALVEIATFALPKGEHASRYEVQRFDRALRNPTRASPGYVTLTLRILHREGYDEPPDDCERECLAEIESKLTALGARAVARHLGAG